MRHTFLDLLPNYDNFNVDDNIDKWNDNYDDDKNNEGPYIVAYINILIATYMHS